jgi:hypothetical protein
LNQEFKVVHSINEGLGSFTVELCEAVGAPLVKGSRAVHHLKQQQNRQNYFRRSEHSKTYRCKRKLNRKLKYQLYDQRRERSYCKSITDPKLPRKSKTHNEHDYHKS